MRQILSVVVTLALLSTYVVPMSVPSAEPTPLRASMSLWEAYSRGYVTIEQGDYPQYPAIAYDVRNTGPVDVDISEFVMLLSPNPRESSYGTTTQDGILTFATATSGHTLKYGYGQLVVDKVLPGPPWWCPEETQFTQSGVRIVLGGEILPFEMESIVRTARTAEDIYQYIRAYPMVVVGKTVDASFWKEVPQTAGQTLLVELRASNRATKDRTDGTPHPDAPNARVWDIVPAGFVINDASIQPAGYNKTVLLDGSTRIAWPANLPAADITGRVPGLDPTPYIAREFSYRMTTPQLTPGRMQLPRARVSVGADYDAEAHSEVPLLDILQVQRPPVADAGPGYAGYEGNAITFSAAGSSDPDGDPLQFRWDFTADGTWDTAWSSSSTAVHTFPDDFVGQVRVLVTDGHFNVTAEAPVTIRNVSPTVDAGQDRTITERSSVALSVTFRDPGFDAPSFGTSEDFTATVDWGYGPTQAASVVEIPGHEGVSTTGYVNVSHVYGDDSGRGVFEVTVMVCDDDGGCGSDTMDVVVSNVAPAVDHTVIPTGDEAGTLAFQARVKDPGSDDLLVTWWGSCTGWSRPTEYANDATVYPDPDPSPEVNPRDITDSQFVVCGDNGVFDWHLMVEDDDGGVTVVSGTFTVGNLPPALTVMPPSQVSVDEGTLVTLDAAAEDPGSDDLSFAWEWEYGFAQMTTYFNDGMGPDPPNSPDGTFPFAASDSSSFTYGDDGTYTVTLTIEDDDGAVLIYETTVVVSNLPPTLKPSADQATDEGTLLSFSFDFSDPGFDQPAAGTVEDFTANADWGDGTSSVLAVSEVPGGPGVPTTGTATGTHVFADDGVYTVTVTVCDDDGGCDDGTLFVTVANVPPTVDAGPDREVDEASAIDLTFAFSDPGFDNPYAGTVEDFTAVVDWGYGPLEPATVVEVPGSPGVPTTGTVSVSHVYGDNGVFTVTVTVCDDDGGCGSDAMVVAVRNVDPTIVGDVTATFTGDLTLRVAGEKWHDVTLTVYDGDTPVHIASVTRYPGSPDDQAVTVHDVTIDLRRGDFRAVVLYTPDDDPVNGQPNGADPAWLILTARDGTQVRIHHTFNVQHEETWTWVVDDLRVLLVGMPIDFTATAGDVGSDDLTFTWDFGDGSTATAAYFNDGLGPDPYPSPEVNPITATDAQAHAFASAGTYTVTLTVTDDDGGTTMVSFVVQLG